jgi:uncharacterized protein
MRDRFFCPIGEAKFKIADYDAMEFAGYGAVFNNVDDGGDMIVPGAFAETIAESKASGDWPMMLSQHGGLIPNSADLTPVGLWTEMKEDDYGLYMRGKLADTARGRELYTLMKMEPRPAIRGLSIGYQVKGHERGNSADPYTRKLTRLKLGEVSLATFPMNRRALVDNVKSIEDLSSMAEVEAYLREAGGLSRNEAKHLIAKIKGTDQRDVGDVASLAAAIHHNCKTLRG